MEEFDHTSISFILDQLGLSTFLRLSSSRILSVNHYYVCRRSIADIQAPHLVKSAFMISPISEEDINEIRNELRSCSIADRKEILSRLLFHQSGFKNCYVIRNGRKIAYMQWIIYPEENGVIREKYGKKFYPLAESQVMIENAFTFPPYRGLGYLPAGTQQLLDQARARGYRSAVCYIRKDNINSLNEFSRMGFKITKMVPEYKILGKVWRTL